MKEVRDIVSRSRDRILGSLKIHLDAVRIAGEKTTPVVVLEGVWIENTTEQNQFVSDLAVQLDMPNENASVRTEWRKYRLPKSVPPGGNVASFGRTDDTWDVLVWLADALPIAEGNFHGFVMAVGRDGFRQPKTDLAGTFNIADR